MVDALMKSNEKTDLVIRGLRSIEVSQIFRFRDQVEPLDYRPKDIVKNLLLKNQQVFSTESG